MGALRTLSRRFSRKRSAQRAEGERRRMRKRSAQRAEGERSKSGSLRRQFSARPPHPHVRGGAAVHSGNASLPDPSHTPRLAELSARLAARSAPTRLVGLRGAARAVAIARLLEAHAEAPTLVVGIGAKATDALLEDLRLVLGEPPPELGGRVRAFPAPDTTPCQK